MAIVNYQDIIDNLNETAPISTDPNTECFGIICDNVTKIGTLYYNILVTLLYVASIAAVLTFIYAGITYMTAGGETEKTEKAKKMIIGSIIGILIISASYIIFKETIAAVSSSTSSGTVQESINRDQTSDGNTYL